MSMAVETALEGQTAFTEADVNAYYDQGYISINDVFTSDEVSELQAVTDEFTERSRSRTESDGIFDLEPSHGADRPMLRQLKHADVLHPAYDRAMRNERVLNLVQQLLGHDIRFSDSKLNLKPAHGGSPVEWHQDWAFYPHTNDDLLTVGIAIDEQRVENGCLLVAPGTHLGETLDHHYGGFFVGAVDPKGLTENAVALPLRAGGIEIHHVRLAHGSAPNRSENSRRLLLLEYAIADAWPLTGGQDWAELNGRMLRGQLPIEPRMLDIPVRLPYPIDPANQGSIFEIQKAAGQRAFTTV
jgi:ectoine hydroxylase-related dioxygenase (phytanoyl-CoA dioxygenase family)